MKLIKHFLYVALSSTKTLLDANAFHLSPVGNRRSPRMKTPLQTTSDSAGDVFITALTADRPEVSSCYAVRRSVFIEEQQVPVDIEMDANDATAVHLLASCDGVPCGAARLVLMTDDHDVDGAAEAARVGKIGRVCVLASHRRRGIGRKIVLCAVEELGRSLGRGGIARLGAQVHALSFYESMGFRLLPGAEYMDAGGVPHRDMEMVT